MATLPAYRPRNGDIILWRPLRPREYAICAVTGQFHHASMLYKVNNIPCIIEQNIDLVSEEIRPLKNLLDDGYTLDVFRYGATDVKDRQKLVQTMLMLQPLPYSYLDAVRVLFRRRKGPACIQVMLEDKRLTLTFEDGSQQTVSSLTCVAAIEIAFLIALGIRLCETVPNPCFVMPNDIATSPRLVCLGSIRKTTRLVGISASD